MQNVHHIPAFVRGSCPGSRSCAPRVMAVHRLLHSAWSIGSLAIGLAMAALGFDLLLHGVGMA